MIPVYVINLRESVDRHAHMVRELTKAEIPFVFIPAIGRNEITETNGLLTKNQTACALSHLKVLNLIAENESEWTAVLEDDAFLSLSAKQFFTTDLLRSLPHYDIIQLFNSNTKAAYEMQMARVGSHTLVARSRPYTGMIALIYHRNAARRIVQDITNISHPIDEMVFNRVATFGLRIVSVQPEVIHHGNFPSTVLWPLRKVKTHEKIQRELVRGTNCIKRTASFIAAWT